MGADNVDASKELAELLDAAIQQEIENMKEHAARLMKIECSCGTMQQFINIPEDHGVYAHSDDQPLLNANDFKPEEHIYMLGRCNSKVNPDNDKFKKYSKDIFKFLTNPPGIGSIDLLLDATRDALGFGGEKCKPVIEEVWKKGNEHSCMDGAAAIGSDCTCMCKYGGIITFSEISVDELKASFEKQQNAEEDDTESEESSDQEEESDDILDSLPDKMADQIRSMNAIGEEDSALADAMAQDAQDWYAQNPMTPDSPMSMGNSNMAMNSFYNNSVMMPYSSLNEYGFITNPHGLSMYNIGNTNLGNMGGCAMGTYNVFQGLGMQPQMGNTISMIEGFQTVPGYVDLGPTSVNMMTMSNCINQCGFKTQIMGNHSFQSYMGTMHTGDLVVIGNPQFRNQPGSLEFTTFKQTDMGLMCQEQTNLSFTQFHAESQLNNSYFMHVSAR